MRKTAAVVGLALIGAFGGIMGGARPASAQTTPPSSSGVAIVQTALKYLGATYASSLQARFPNTGFSDLGFVAYAYNQNDIKLHLNWSKDFDYARLLQDGAMVKHSRLQSGDVIFFKNTVHQGVSHVGIYIGGGEFVHAEWFNRGVKISSFKNDPVDGNYWSAHYLTATRPWSG